MSHLFPLRWSFFSCQENSDILLVFSLFLFSCSSLGVCCFLNFLDKLFLLLIFTEFIWLEPYNFGQVIGPPNVLFFFFKLLKVPSSSWKKKFCASPGLSAFCCWKDKNSSTKFARDVFFFYLFFLRWTVKQMAPFAVLKWGFKVSRLINFSKRKFYLHVLQLCCLVTWGWISSG